MYMGKQLISMVTTGTAQLQIASTTAVPNLNAAFWGGYSSDRFFDPASCIQNRTTQQAGRTSASMAMGVWVVG
jgi:hypothetical protein